MSSRRTSLSSVLLSIATLIPGSLPLLGQKMSVRSEQHHDVSPAVRNLPTIIKNRPVEHEAEPVRRVPLPSGLKRIEDPDTVLQKTSASGSAGASSPLTPQVGLGFDGIGNGVFGFAVSSAPPDTNGAVGLTQYVQWVNTSFAVFNKATGSLVKGPVAGNSLWQGFGGGCESNNNGDPVVTYDKLANRWVFSQFVTSSPFLQCVAVSTTPDATGTYNRYSFTYPNFVDYPKMGVWPDAYYETFNVFTSTSFLGADVCAYDRNAMLNGQTATQICFQQGPSVGSLVPADLDGITLPPARSPNYQVTMGSNALNLYKFHVDFVTPANSTFTGPTSIAVAPFTALCNGGGNCVPQPGTTTGLDSLADRLMYRLAYRNFGNHESLVIDHSVAAGSSAGVRWYEIQSPNGTPSVAQQSTFAPDGNFRWMGGVAMDRTGDLAVGYSVASSTLFPSIAYAGRIPSDTLSTLESEITIVSGGGSQTNGLTRWGDYTAIQVDPMDDCTFWYTTEYLKSSGNFNWNTRIANFRFPNCGGTPLTSWIQNDSPHFIYQDQNQHLRQLLFANGAWSTQDLTALTGAPLASLQNGLTSWVQSDGPHFVYEDVNQHLRQFFFINNAWQTQDLTTTTGAPVVSPQSSLNTWTEPNGPHFVFLDQNQHVHQLFFINGAWQTENLTNTTGAPVASPQSGFTSWVQSDGPHFVFEDANQHLRQMWFSGAWHTEDLTNTTGAPVATPGSALTSWVQGDGPHFVFQDTNQHVRQMWFSGAWHTEDLTALTGAPVAEPNSALTSWVEASGPHFVYADGNQHLRELLFVNNAWGALDLTATTGAAVATPGSMLTSWIQSDGPHFIWQDANQHLHQFFFEEVNNTWNNEDLSNTTGAPPAE